MCGPCPHSPQVHTSGNPIYRCTHPNHVRNPPMAGEFELVGMWDGLGRFDTVPFMGVIQEWERVREPSSVFGNQGEYLLSSLLVQAICYSYEHSIYANVINSMLEVFKVLGPKLLRNKKKIGGSYYFHLCEMLKDLNNTPATATFMMAVCTGKRPTFFRLKNHWGTKDVQPTPLSLWNLFHDVLSLSEADLEETIATWTTTAMEWAMALMNLKCAHKRLQKQFPLYLTEIFDSDEDQAQIQQLIKESLRAGCDRKAISEGSLVELRAQAIKIQEKLSVKMQAKGLTPYDIDLLKYYVVSMGQLCTTSEIVRSLYEWQTQREEGMKALIALAKERMQKDAAMQELVGPYDESCEDSSSEDEEASGFELPSSKSTSPTISACSMTETEEMKLEDIVIVELNESDDKDE